MKKMIVTTTINSPTEAIRKFDNMEGWELLVVGDRKTPEYKLENGLFLPASEWLHEYIALVNVIGFNSVRLGRMVAFIEAHKRGAEIVASIDDDCYPDDDWGKNVVLGERIDAWEFIADRICFDPISVMSYSDYPHRGYPLELAYKKTITRPTALARIIPLVREDICKGQSDFNAIDRITQAESYYENKLDTPYFADCFSPINTQNTFIHGSVLKDFFANIPFIGRADDIWAGYIFQALHPRSTIYGNESANHQQDRPIQSLVDDLDEEIFMYRNTFAFLNDLTELIGGKLEFEDIELVLMKYLPAPSLRAIKIYRSYFDD
jgi:hypothetical protein